MLGMERTRGLEVVLCLALSLRREVKVLSLRMSGPVAASAARAASGARKSFVREVAMVSRALGGRGLREDGDGSLAAAVVVREAWT